MSDKICEAIIISCIDFRFQSFIDKWIAENLPPYSYDRVEVAGGVRDLATIINQLSLSKKLHGIKKVILINHEDCGAYGLEGTLEKHTQDLKTAAKKIKALYPDLEIQAFYLHLDGIFQSID